MNRRKEYPTHEMALADANRLGWSLHRSATETTPLTIRHGFRSDRDDVLYLKRLVSGSWVWVRELG